MTTIELLLCADWVLTMQGEPNPLNQHAVAIHQGNIVEVLPTSEAKSRYQAKQTIELPNHVLMPGLINAHTHSPMSLLRGLADDLPLMDWLNHHIWPAEQRVCNPDYIRDGMLLACSEMIRSGTTCFNEHYFFPREQVEIAREAGLRATIGLIVMSVPNDYASTEQDYLDKAQHAIDTIDTGELIQFSYAPHAPYTCSNTVLSEIQRRAERDQLRVHMHMHESAPEIEQSLREFNQRPLARLHQLGLISPQFINVHMTQIVDEDRAILRETGAHVVHCPESNLKLASGYAPIQTLLDDGINVALGTDGAASNNDLDLFGEMRTAALIGKTIANDPTAIDAYTALQMSTCHGAKALGLEHVTGRLVPGLSADIIAVDMNHFNTQPCYHPISHLVYSVNARQVSNVWVAGKRLLDQGRLTTIDEERVLQTAKQWRDKIVSATRS